MDLSKKLPSDNTIDGIANFIYEKKFEHPSLVVGAYDDFIVDKEGLRESALYLGIEVSFNRLNTFMTDVLITWVTIKRRMKS